MNETELVLDVGPVAHGGHCVARADGRVVFVRHALPGERVRARVTQVRRDFLRADAVEVLVASPDRVEPPCPFARPGVCGGCDFQHATPAAQRALKTRVLTDQLERLGGLGGIATTVEPLPGGPFGWRTRVQYAVDEQGRLGFHRHRSHHVVPVDRCLIAHPELADLPTSLPVALAGPASDSGVGPPLGGSASESGVSLPLGGSVEAVASSGGDVTVLTRGSRDDPRWRVVTGPPRVVERVLDRPWTIDAAGFWQVHPAAPATLTEAVLDLLRPRAGERAWDLYGGAGLFAAALAAHCGPVTVVESDRRAVASGRRALRDLPNVRFVEGDAARVLTDPRWRSVDLVVLDPPRSGAGRNVVTAIAARHPRAVAYVSCDPAAFARDVRTFGELGYALLEVRGYDAFPNTHHLESIGLFEPED